MRGTLLVAERSEHSGDLPLDQPLHAMAGRFGDHPPGAVAIRQRCQNGGARIGLGQVLLVEVVVEPGMRASPPHAATDV